MQSVVREIPRLGSARSRADRRTTGMPSSDHLLAAAAGAAAASAIFLAGFYFGSRRERAAPSAAEGDGDIPPPPLPAPLVLQPPTVSLATNHSLQEVIESVSFVLREENRLRGEFAQFKDLVLSRLPVAVTPGGLDDAKPAALHEAEEDMLPPVSPPLSPSVAPAL